MQAVHLLAMHQKHCKGAMEHFLEVACGPARHAALIARAAGAGATAVDVSPAMLEYARGQAEAAGVAGSMHFVQADMTKGEGALLLDTFQALCTRHIGACS